MKKGKSSKKASAGKKETKKAPKKSPPEEAKKAPKKSPHKEAEKKPKESKEGKVQLYQLAKELGLSSRQLRSFFVSKKVRLPERNYSFIRLTPAQVELAKEVFIKRRIIMGRPFRARGDERRRDERRGDAGADRRRGPAGAAVLEKKGIPPEKKFGPRVPTPHPPRERRDFPRPRVSTSDVEVIPVTPHKAPPKKREGHKRVLSKDEQRVKRAQKRLIKQRREELLESEEEFFEEEEEFRVRPSEQRTATRKKEVKEFKRPERLELELPVSVRELSAALGLKAADIIMRLMREGIRLTINDNLPPEKAVEIAESCGVKLSFKRETDVEEILAELEKHPEGAELLPRPPIVALLGHVDHGKTSLLDYIRKSNVHEQEAGGITQHISAYKVRTDYGEVTFIDTPGHEAFTALRARGANVTDIVVLVVAADDGVMPQTEEAISHARAADVPIIVALNKIDKPNANRLRAKQQLSDFGLMTEEWGGDTVVVECSAVTGEGVSTLLEMISIVAEMLELRADPSRPATGYVVEAKLTEGVGVVSTLLVRDGTLRVGDVLLCGSEFGKVRALYTTTGSLVKEAPPATPVLVTGLPSVPEAGEKFYVVGDLQKARQLSLELAERKKKVASSTHITLENLYERLKEQKVKELCVVVKGDVRGSLEAVEKILSPMGGDEVRIRILHLGVGAVSDSDILLADASDAIVVAFSVGITESASKLAKERSVQVRHYDVIYELAEDIKAALEGMLEPEEKEVFLGRLVVRQIFRIPRVGLIAGCYVEKGRITRDALVRIYRGDELLLKSRVENLKRFKDDVKEVREGFECGLRIKDYNDAAEGDTIEAFTIEKVARKLSGRE